jgi:hypothetical protein
MANDVYTKELRKILTDKAPAPATTMTVAQIQEAISTISNQLRGPLPNVERLNLVEDRARLRKQLAAIS